MSFQPSSSAVRGGTIALASFAVAGAGALVPVSPLLALIPLGISGLLSLLALGRRVNSIFLTVLGVLLVGYAFLGRGFAYLGVPPLFIGETVLALALVAMAMSLARLRFGPIQLLLLAYMAWGVVRTVPFVSRYGLDAIRDAALWYYALFAVAISLVANERVLQSLVGWYRRAVPAFVLWVPVAAVLHRLFRDVLPTAPGSDVSIPYFKGGDMGIHLAGVAGFTLAGLYASGRHTRIPESVLWLAWLCGVAMAGSINRGGLVAAGVGLLGGLVLFPGRRSVSLIAGGTVLIVVLALVNPQIDFGGQRTVSLGQISSNVQSVFFDTGASALESTKEWRLEWWKEIYGYTFQGPYFLTGKGYGVNLADSDGFQVLTDSSLRSPHNSHMSVLARTGVPGFLLWVALQATFGASLLLAARRAQRAGQVFWAQLDGWLFLYWLAFIADSTFDVVLEGPHLGIWFWSIYGLGLAALQLQPSVESPIAPAVIGLRGAEPMEFPSERMPL